ncbi:histidine phosphatase family protein [Gulosibacter chungangensis]|uniref:Phosphoglycerate mutase n=1 Tax=Gulosibacter chungangensis TaxID=979746 RepID=A0A7J5BB30_9MICO|nr:histidine phosphatase family protein [Gulosibacter chungangensis]KAB1642227.1 phosphoglycerate mutase [Gulosibacter chungangensis]
MSPEIPVTRILLVRHGQTPTTGKELPGRAPGLHLAEKGREQAARVAERLADLHIDALYSSPLERALETAEPTASSTGLPVLEEPGLLETNVGDWTGRALSDLAKLLEWQTVQREPSTFRFPGGESFVEQRDRMRATIERIRSAHVGGTVVCFSHADPIRVFLSDALGMPLDALQRVSVSPCSVSAVAYRDGSEPVVLTVNSTHSSLAELVAA